MRQSLARPAERAPLGRPGRKTGASAIKFRPESGRIQHVETSDSQSVSWELSEGLWPGKKLEFLSRFRVRSADRTFELKQSTANWSNSQQKRSRVRSVDRKFDRKKSITSRSNVQQIRPGEFASSDDTRLDLIVGDIMNSRPPAEAALEFCKWVKEHIKYDASVSYSPRDLAAILMYKKSHCGHQKNVFYAMCSRAGIPTRTVAGLNLYKPDGVGHLNEIRADFDNAHSYGRRSTYPDRAGSKSTPALVKELILFQPNSSRTIRTSRTMLFGFMKMGDGSTRVGISRRKMVLPVRHRESPCFSEGRAQLRRSAFNRFVLATTLT